MISSLSIQNFGLIAHSHILFNKGFTAITGETGAGKSFFCKALEIGLGERIKKMPPEKTIIEVECFGHTFRRIIDQKKSRFFIDDIPASLEEAENIIGNRFHFHRQHDTAFLASATAPVILLDEAMHESILKNTFQTAFVEWKNAQKTLETMQQKQEKWEEMKGFWEFSLEQMREIQFSDEDLEEAEKLIAEENDNEAKTRYFEKAIIALSDEENGAITQLQKIEEALIKTNHPEKETVGSYIMPLAALLHTLEKTKPTLNTEVENAKILIKNVQKWCKSHSVISPQDLLTKKKKLETQLEEVLHLSESIENQKKHTAQLFENANKLANELAKKRKVFLPSFEETITKTCQELGMPPARFAVECTPCPLSMHGNEHIEFLFSANKNQPLAKLSSVASGGEKSRIMLALHQFTPEDSVIIFDEIDTGVSGSVAEKMATMMKQLATHRQIIAITHLPQIAAKADHHIVVSKKHDEEKTTTTLREVTGEERISALTHFIAGTQSPEGRKVAEAMMKN